MASLGDRRARPARGRDAGAGLLARLRGHRVPCRGARVRYRPRVPAPTLSFAAGTLLSLAAVRPFLLKHIHSESHGVRTNVDALIGRIGTVSERIDPVTGKGRVPVEGEDWRGASIMDTPIDAGDRVMVVRVEGTTLFVDKEG